MMKTTSMQKLDNITEREGIMRMSIISPTPITKKMEWRTWT